MDSADEYAQAHPDQHWSDVAYCLNKVHSVDLEDRIQANLTNVQSAHLLKRSSSPNVVSSPSMVGRPTSTHMESYVETENEAGTKKSMPSQNTRSNGE